MTNDAAGSGWFGSVPPDDLDAARDVIENDSAETPEDWPAKAVESGFAEDESDYYGKLHEATLHAAREAVQERERADDQQLTHSIRAMDDTPRVAWLRSLFRTDARPGSAPAGELLAPIPIRNSISSRKPSTSSP